MSSAGNVDFGINSQWYETLEEDESNNKRCWLLLLLYN